MAHIKLVVTEAVIRQVNRAGVNERAGLNQRQITIRDASPELITAFRAATSDNQVLVALNDEFKFSVGDPWAIWDAHQQAGLQPEDFTSLYDLLARRSERVVEFACRACA